jgi:ubiquinone/menaquinone biosynthesis C-methylase UbiE
MDHAKAGWQRGGSGRSLSPHRASRLARATETNRASSQPSAFSFWSNYDAASPSFDRHRALPGSVPEAVRRAVLGVLERSRVLDLGAGTGRIGRAFVDAGDDYVGVDLSFGMLREFRRRDSEKDQVPRLVQADGHHLPFLDATFDAVLLIQVVGAAQSWRELTAEARRVLRSPGSLIIGHTVMPSDGLDDRMKRHLAFLLRQMSVSPYHINPRADSPCWLEVVGPSHARVIAASWRAERTPRAFVERQPTGARFSALPEAVKDEALRRLGAWAIKTFGSLDTAFSEWHEFELRVFKV